MASYDEYNKKFLKSSESSLNEGINTANQNAQKSKDIINTKYDGQKKTLQENHDTDVANTTEAYENAFKSNEVQVKLNERYLERKAAEIGLTDSGMNRTQMTANQLSYANQKGELTRQRQKAIETLAATMRAKMTEIDSNQAADIAEVDMNLNSSIAQLKADNQKWASEQAVDAVKAEQEATTKAAEAQRSAYSNLVSAMIKGDLDEDQKINAFKAYCSMYDFDSREQAQAVLDYAGIDGKIDNEGNLILNDSYSSSGKTQSYTIRKTKDTMNGFLGLKGLFGGIDSNDTYEIVNDATREVVKTISDIDDFSSLTNAQKKQLSNLNIDDELSTDVFKFSADGLRRFIKSIS